MKIGVPKEIKTHEYRVAITPSLVAELVKNNHKIFIETQAGVESGYLDEVFEKAGATIVKTAEQAWNQEMILKVKEPQPSEYKYFKPNLILFTFLHLAAEQELTKELLKNQVISLAYEMISTILRPMSEIAGKRSVLSAAMFLEKQNKGQGILLSNIPGLSKPKVVILGGGNAGLSACRLALGLDVDLYVLELNEDRLRFLDQILNGKAQVLKSNNYNLQQVLPQADVVISTILIPGAKATKIVSEELVKSMKPNSIIIDVAIDQGGSVETITKPTTHSNPTFIKHDVIHYAVANIPGAVPRTATNSLVNATFKYVLDIANKGWKKALLDDCNLFKTLSTFEGNITCKPVAEALEYEYIDGLELLKK